MHLQRQHVDADMQSVLVFRGDMHYAGQDGLVSYKAAVADIPLTHLFFGFRSL